MPRPGPLPEATLPALFEGQVARTPEALALLCGEERLSYGALNARANRLAHWLLAHGVGPERVVGIALERSPEMVVALLATLKAGGAYLPLDPEYPAARLAQMLGEAAPVLVLTSRSVRARLPQELELLALDAPETQAALARAPTHNPTDADRPTPLRPQHPAYVIYTSGSTGRPKGAPNSHWGWSTGSSGCRLPMDLRRRTGCCRKRPTALTCPYGSFSGHCCSVRAWWSPPRANTGIRGISSRPSGGSGSPRCISSPRCCALFLKRMSAAAAPVSSAARDSVAARP